MSEVTTMSTARTTSKTKLSSRTNKGREKRNSVSCSNNNEQEASR